jgi:hypothetical protein
VPTHVPVVSPAANAVMEDVVIRMRVSNAFIDILEKLVKSFI